MKILLGRILLSAALVLCLGAKPRIAPGCEVMRGLVPDCDSDRVAESSCEEEVCVVGSGVILWHDGERLVATVHFKDKAGRWWVKVEDARRDEEGRLLVEPARCDNE